MTVEVLSVLPKEVKAGVQPDGRASAGALLGAPARAHPEIQAEAPLPT